MTFYVRKTLAPGPIRFGVSPRSPITAIDPEPVLSTGGSGEFLRRRLRGFYFADTRDPGALVVPDMPSISSTPFWTSVFDGTTRGWLFVGMMVFGVLLILLGLAVISNTDNNGIGIFEIILGLILIGVPIGITAQGRRQIKVREDQERAAREAEHQGHQEILSAYSAALEKVRNDPSEANLATVGRERDRIDLPYRIWSPVARSTVLHIGFQALEKYGPAGARQVNDIMSRAAHSTGLNPADELRVKLDLYRVAVWHLLADDRFGPAQVEQLHALRDGLEIDENDVPVEMKAISEFDGLRGINHKNLPKAECSVPLGFHEYCIHSTRGHVLRPVREKVEGIPTTKLVPSEQCQIVVTNKRIILDAKKRQEIGVPKIDDVEVDVDPNILTIRPARGMKSVTIQVEDPIVTAALIDVATMLDERPRGFS
ncbi:MAG TPA: hypothetical protein VF111_12300 [Thermoanaerobaculia bacterium]